MTYNEACSPLLGRVLPSAWRVGWTGKDLAAGNRDRFYWIDLAMHKPEYREKSPLIYTLLKEWHDFRARVQEFLSC
jgi:hypothetical protein